jgi:hypothetical protein
MPYYEDPLFYSIKRYNNHVALVKVINYINLDVILSIRHILC